MSGFCLFLRLDLMYWVDLNLLCSQRWHWIPDPPASITLPSVAVILGRWHHPWFYCSAGDLPQIFLHVIKQVPYQLRLLKRRLFLPSGFLQPRKIIIHVVTVVLIISLYLCLCLVVSVDERTVQLG